MNHIFTKPHVTYTHITNYVRLLYLQRCICQVMCFLTGVPFIWELEGKRRCKSRIRNLYGCWLRSPSTTLTSDPFCKSHRDSLDRLVALYHTPSLTRPHESALRLITSFLFYGHPDYPHASWIMKISYLLIAAALMRPFVCQVL